MIKIILNVKKVVMMSSILCVLGCMAADKPDNIPGVNVLSVPDKTYPLRTFSNGESENIELKVLFNTPTDNTHSIIKAKMYADTWVESLCIEAFCPVNTMIYRMHLNDAKKTILLLNDIEKHTGPFYFFLTSRTHIKGQEENTNWWEFKTDAVNFEKIRNLPFIKKDLPTVSNNNIRLISLISAGLASLVILCCILKRYR